MSKVVIAAVMSAILGLAVGVVLTFSFVDGDSDNVDGTFLGANESTGDNGESEESVWVPDYSADEVRHAPDDDVEILESGIRRFSPSKASREAIREAIATVKMPLPKRRDGIISGVVLDEAGKPMPDVELSVRRSDYQQAPSGENAEEQVQRYLEQVRWQESTRQSQKTSREGTFQFNRVGNGRYQIEVKTDGLRIVHSDRRFIRNLEAGAEVELTLREQALLEVAVMLPSGKMADRAEIVTVDVAGTQRTKKWFSSKRILELDPGFLRIGARIRGDENFRTAEFHEVTLALGNKPSRLLLKLVEEPTLHGRIVFQKGFPQRSVDLYFMRFDGESLSLEELRKEGKRVTTEGDRFNTPLNEPGRYAVGCYSRTAGFNSNVVIAQVGKNTKEVVVELIGLNRADYLEVDIRGPKGEAVLRPSLSTSIRYQQGDRERTKSGRGGLIRRTDGKCWIEHTMLDEGKGPVLENFVRVGCEFGHKKVPYRRSATSSVRVDFGEMATLDLVATGNTSPETLMALDFDLRNEEGIQVARGVQSSNRPRNGDPMDINRESAQKGEWFFAGLQPGDYKLNVKLGGNYRSRALTEIEFSLRAGRNRETVEIPQLYEVTAKIKNGSARNASLELVGAKRKGSIPTARFVDGEVARFNNLLAGSYRMSVRIKNKSMMKSFTLPGTDEVLFDGDDGQTLLVSRCREGSKAYAAGVREGDIVVKLNGNSLSDNNAAYRARGGPKNAETQVITLERDGATRTVTLGRDAYREKGRPLRIR